MNGLLVAVENYLTICVKLYKLRFEVFLFHLSNANCKDFTICVNAKRKEFTICVNAFGKDFTLYNLRPYSVTAIFIGRYGECISFDVDSIQCE